MMEQVEYCWDVVLIFGSVCHAHGRSGQLHVVFGRIGALVMCDEDVPDGRSRGAYQASS